MQTHLQQASSSKNTLDREKLDNVDVLLHKINDPALVFAQHNPQSNLYNGLRS